MTLIALALSACLAFGRRPRSPDPLCVCRPAIAELAGGRLPVWHSFRTRVDQDPLDTPTPRDGRVGQDRPGCSAGHDNFHLGLGVDRSFDLGLGIRWLFGVGVRTALGHWKLPGPRNRVEWERKAFDEILEFGRWALVSSPVSFLLTSGDRLLMGALFTATDMGLYSIALLLVTTISRPCWGSPASQFSPRSRKSSARTPWI